MQPNRSILIVVPTPAAKAAGVMVLRQAYNNSNISVTLDSYRTTPSPTDLRKAAADYDAVLLIGGKHTSPAEALNSPFIRDGENIIPVGWLPCENENDILQFAKSVTQSHGRAQDEPAIALLSQRHPRFIRLIDRMLKILANETINAFKWTSDLLFREHMLEGISSGMGLATYFGHGRPIGWVGYYGLRAHHFMEAEKRQPLGAMLSLCCETASRKRTNVSFSEQLVLDGYATASFGAVDKTLHTDNTRWAVGISKALTKSVTHLADLLVQAVPQNKSAYESYRLIGDPLAPLWSPRQSIQFSNQIKTYP